MLPTAKVHPSGFMHHIYLFLSVNDRNQQELSSPKNQYIQMSETSVENLLNSASLTLKELEIPREKLLPGTLQVIKHGRYGSIYRAELETGNPGKTTTVILKSLQGKAHGQKAFCYRSVYQRRDVGQNFAVITRRDRAVFSNIASHSSISIGPKKTAVMLIFKLLALFFAASTWC